MVQVAGSSGPRGQAELSQVSESAIACAKALSLYSSLCESKPGGGGPLPTSCRNKAGEADRER